MTNKAPLLLVEWVDSRQPTASWQRVTDLDYLSECKCTSIGFLIRDDNAKVLAASVADDSAEMQAAAGIRHTHCRAVTSTAYGFFFVGTCVKAEAAADFWRTVELGSLKTFPAALAAALCVTSFCARTCVSVDAAADFAAADALGSRNTWLAAVAAFVPVVSGFLVAMVISFGNSL